MGVHRATSRWWPAVLRHSVWIAAALAVFSVTAAVSYAARERADHAPDDTSAIKVPRNPTSGRGGGTASHLTGDVTSLPAPPNGSMGQVDAGSGAPALPGGADSGGTAQATSQAGQQQTATHTITAQPGSGAAFVADYSVSTAWDTGYVAMIVIRNRGNAPAAWELRIQLPRQATVANYWNAAFAVNAQDVLVTPPSYSPMLAQGAEVTIGYQVNRNNAGIDPQYCAVNGSPCQ